MKLLNKKKIFFVFLLINIILLSSIISAAYSETLGYSPIYNHLGGSGIFSGLSSLKVDESMCSQGTDFIVQISPLSCEPIVVTSDLLAEENVNVFCKMTGTKINPLIDVGAINTIRFAKDYPKEVLSIGYMPAQSALGYTDTNLFGSLSLDNLGYVVITLKKQPNESALTNCDKTILGNEVCWINGSLTANFNYDVKNAFGVGSALFYLPVMDEDEWKDNYVRYGFWNGRGYLRAEDVDENGAIISIYSDKTVLRGVLTGERTYALQKYSQNINLDVGGEASNKIYLPGLSPCLASLQLQLKGIEDPDTYVRLKVNDDYLELRDGEYFLDGKCLIQNLDSKGLSQEVKIKCREDDKAASPFSLRIFPKVDLEVNGKVDSYEVGDYLYQTSDGKKFVYLGYIGVAGDEVVQASEASKENLYVYLVAIPEHRTSLLDDEITSVAKHAESIRSTSGKTGTIAKISEGFTSVVGTNTIYIGKYIIKGEQFKFIPYGESKDYEGGTVSFEGLSRTDNDNSFEEDEDSAEEYINHYNDAMSSFETVLDNYPGEVADSQSLQDYGELALIDEINLAYAVGQGQTMLELCKQFATDYPGSIHSPDICLNVLKISNSKNAVKEVLINGDIFDISFEGVSDPSINDYSATVLVQGPHGDSKTFYLRKNKVVSLESFREESELGTLKVSEYIMLEELDGDSARIKISVDNHGDKKNVLVDSKTLQKGASSEKYGEYTFILTDITLKKVAKVSVIPNIDYAKSNSTFNFKIGVEKRAIQLTPEKTEEKIEQINKSLEDLNKVSKVLGGVVSTGKAACAATSVALTFKNLIKNINGGATARQEVMTGEGGWNKKCADEMNANPTRYSSLNSCFLAHSNEIEGEVAQLSNVINRQNQMIKALSSENSEEFLRKYSESVESTLNSLTTTQAEGINGLSEVKAALNNDALRTDGKYTFEDLKEIQMYAMYLQSTSSTSGDEFRSTALQRLNSVIKDVNKNSEDYLSMVEKSKGLNIDPSKVYYVSRDIEGKSANEIKTYQGETLEKIGGISSLSNLKPTNPIATMQIGGEVYVLILNGDVKSPYYPVMRDSQGSYLIYDVNKNLVTDGDVINKLKNYVFQIVEASSFKNTYIKSYGSSEILLKYSGTYAYRDKPVVVPFDKKEGWYAGITSPETAYDSSGVIRQFWLCNVGPDGIEEFSLQDFGGDSCILINTAQANEANPFSNFVDVPAKVKEAIQAISVAQRRYKEGVTSVNINPNVGNVKVGEPLTATNSGGECTDFMSAEDCNLLFNVCDPFICPSSRCNFGGKYPVQDVIQTGVVGGFFLCYPNAKWEGGEIYVPFCISAINAGLENWITVKEDYADCLQTSLDTGETVGICDEMHSIYLCEFFWKQSLPVIKLMGERILEKVTGQGTKGGGEYQSIVQAFKTAQDSFNYVTQYYAANSYRAFKFRSTSEIGSSICGTFASVVYPDQGTFLSNLIAPDSPFQFTGKFEETQLTTSTNPPTSHYKVYFHIYAGTDSGAYYSVKLRGSGSSYYQDTAMDRMVDSGYIPRGDSADESIDFTAPSGYSTLCITVNGQEECGFKEVSTSFAVNYLSDLYVKDQATDKDIKTQKDCISGSASIYSLADLNIVSIADNLLDSELYAQGIIRVCSTNNPGSGTDPYVGKENERWKKVGRCDDENIGCWIDTQSVKDAIKALDVEEDAVSDIAKNAQEYLSDTYYTAEEFKAKKEEIEAETNMTNRIALINTILKSGKVFYNNQNAYLYLQKGRAYASLAITAYATYLSNQQAAQGTPSTPGTTPSTDVDAQFNAKYISPYLYFNDKSLLKFDDRCYRYYNSEWQFAISCDPSVPFFSVHGLGTNYTNPVSNFVEGIIVSLQKYDGDYLGGLTFLVNKVLADKNAELAEKTHNIAKMDEKGLFSVESGMSASYSSNSPAGEVPLTYFFKYVNNKWQWSADNENWMDTNTLTISGGDYNGVVTEQGTTGYLLINGLNALNGKGIYQGAALIFDSTSKDLQEFLKVSSAPVTSSLESSLQRRDLNKLIDLMNLLSTSVSSASFNCYCGTECGNYAKWIVQYAGQSNIPDELLLLAIMIQESSCRSVESSDGKDIGLMQINLGNCGFYGLPSNTVSCKSELLNDKETNIKTGAQILSDKYTYFSAGRTFSCAPVIENYAGWEAALRGYNGWGCTGDNNYVENVKKKYFELVNLYGGGSSSTPAPTGSSSASRQAVYTAMQTLNGEPRSILVDMDGGGISCWDSMLFVYDSANVKYNCIYSDKSGTSYTYNGKTITTSSSLPYQISENGCDNVGLSETAKLNLLQMGDLLSVVYNENVGHNVIFVRWVDKNAGLAWVYDWGAFSGSKVFEFSTIDISNNAHSVYMAWEPVSK